MTFGFKLTGRLLSLLRQVILPRPFPGLLPWLRRVAILGLAFPFWLLLQALHGLGFLADEILFRGYRRVAVREPVFVLGVPRSGTTFLHRLLAADPRFTTFSTWECLFAPSIAERYLWRGVGAADRAIGRPLGRLLGWLERRVFSALDDVHPMSLADPEEDYLVFLPLLACFILVVPFPEAAWVWRMGRFDVDVPAAERRTLLRFYRRCIQKHLYVHGAGRVFLSKNASFAGMAGSLRDAFPGSRFVICERDALQVIASQFASLAGGLALCGMSPGDARFRSNLLDCIDFYYENLARVSGELPEDRLVRVPLFDLSRRTREVVKALYDRFGFELPESVLKEIAEYEDRPARARPRTKRGADLSSWGLDAEDLRHRFGRWRQEEVLRL